MAMDAHEIERLIKQGIPDAKVSIRDLAGDGDHYAAEVVSASFKGKTRVQQHQMVYKASRATWAACCMHSPCRPARRSEAVTIGDFVKGVVSDVLNDMLKKATTTKRRRRRRRAATPTERLRQIEKLLKPAKRQTSAKRTVRKRSKARRRAS